jgi:hypothetical protein
VLVLVLVTPPVTVRQRMVRVPVECLVAREWAVFVNAGSLLFCSLLTLLSLLVVLYSCSPAQLCRLGRRFYNIRMDHTTGTLLYTPLYPWPASTTLAFFVHCRLIGSCT